MKKTETDFFLSGFLTLDFWRKFFMGTEYPAIVAILVLFGNLTSLDYYVNFIITGLFVFAMLISDSIRPAIITLCTYIYQISIPHAPGYPTYSDFLFSEWRRPVSVIIIFAVFFAFLAFFIRKKIYKSLTKGKTPFFFPLIVFSISLMMNGAFSGNWTYKNLIFAFLNTLVYFFLFVVLYHGFSEKEKSKELVEYFCYISLLISVVIICEMLHLFIGVEDIFSDGQIVKDKVALGWGIWNIIGTSLAVLIPVLFYGAMTAKRHYVYFVFATLSYAFCVLSMSRNALVFSTLAYFSCILIACFFGNHKKLYRIITLVGAAIFLIFALIFLGKIKVLLSDYFERGFSDNGRYELWRLAIETFKESPVFGNGFYGFFTDAVFEYSAFPRMAHNTVFQLLSAMGILGLLSYAWYRIETASVFFSRPSLKKTMLGMSILVFLFGSLLDNFVFNIHPPIYYTVALAIVCRTHLEENNKS